MFKWLYPGMRVKRWLGTMGVGIAMVAVGVYLAVGLHIAETVNEATRWILDRSRINVAPLSAALGIVMIAAGLLLVLYAIQRIVRSVTDVVAPYRKEGISELVYRQRALSHGQRIVVIGGGTGLSTLLRGLKRYTSNLTAIVTVTDDGGSSGRLVRIG